MSVRDLLVERARDYELRVASCGERAELGEHGQRDAAVGFAAVAVALREVADVLDAENEDAL